MKRMITLTIGLAAILSMMMCIDAKAQNTNTLDYIVKSIEPGSWIVTATEARSGKLVKFRLPPTLFKGQTFDAELNNIKKGQKFVAKGPRNARLDNVRMLNPLPETEKPGKGSIKGQASGLRRTAPPQNLQWEIIHVDPKQWIVKARHRNNRKIIKFKVNPNCFHGFRFRANLKGIKKGKGFSIITPNIQPFLNCCTLL